MTDWHERTGEPEPARGGETAKESREGRPVDGESGERAATTTWVGIVANRSSGVGRGRRLVDDLVHELRRVGLPAEVAWTPEARSLLVQRAASEGGCRCLVAVGGDGTVSALLNERPATPMSVMPAGTENLVARHFGLRRDPHSLARSIAAGRIVPVDIAQAASRRFLLMAGFGFDADVVTRHHRGRISRSGRMRPTSRMAYVTPILRASLSYRFPTISVRILDPGAEELLLGTTVFIFNLPRYALGLPFVPVAREDDGWLDLVVFRHPGPLRAFFYLCKVLCGVHLNDPSVYHRRVRKVVVSASESIPVQLDGDPGGYVVSERPSAPAGGTRVAAVDGANAAGPIASLAEWPVEILPSGMTMLVPARRGRDRTARPPLVSEDRN